MVDGAIDKYPPSRTRGLRPPWSKGASGNPSGLTKDGRAPKVAKLEASLLDELERSGGMQALAKRWVMLAKKGNSTALSAILERLYPVPQEDKQAGRVVLEGLRLELTPTGGASVTMVRQEGTPELGSDASSSSSESRTGGHDTRNLGVPHPLLEASSESPLLPHPHFQSPIEGTSNGVVLAAGSSLPFSPGGQNRIEDPGDAAK